MKLYIDDIRDAPDESWTLIRTITEAIRCIAFFGADITEISLDHDISFDVRVDGVYRPFPSPDSFAAVAYFIGEWVHGNNQMEIPKIIIHSANPVGAEAIESILGVRYGIPCDIKPMGEAFRPK